MSGQGISIIIPVFNEACGIVQLLEGLQDFRRKGAEIIVVDGGSVDDTQRLAGGLADRIIPADRGRGRQMNAGAAMAQGDAFLFLHADTCLPAAALTVVADALANGATWGRFDVRIGGSLRGLGLVALMMNWRSRLTGIATGDQAIFVTREAFRRIGGFPEIAACLRDKVTTSGRRWEKNGLLRTILMMWRLRLRFHFGASPADLAREYGHVPDER